MYLHFILYDAIKMKQNWVLCEMRASTLEKRKEEIKKEKEQNQHPERHDLKLNQSQRREKFIVILFQFEKEGTFSHHKDATLPPY